MSLEALEPVLYLPDDTPFYPEAGDDRQPLRLFWRAVGLMVLAQAAYLWVYWQAGFIWQDDARIVQNTLLWSWGGLGRVWTEYLAGTYAPLTQSLLWGQHHFFGQAAAMYHAMSVLLHGLDAALLWMVLRRLGVRGAWLAAALFAVDPVQAQTVAWASQQSHLLGAAFSLGAIWAFLRLSLIRPGFSSEIKLEPGESIDDYLPPEPVGKLLVLASVLSAAAVLSDPLGVVIPLVLVVLIWRQNGRVTRVQWLQLAPIFAIAAAGAAIAVAARAGGADLVGSGPPLSVLQRVLVACRAAWLYAAAAVDPYPLTFVYPRWDAGVGVWWQWVSPAGLLVFAATAWAGRKRWGRWPLAGLLVFLALLLPAFWTILGVSGPAIFVADHLEYLALAAPLAVVAALIVWGLSWTGETVTVRLSRVAAALVFLGGLAVLTWLQAGTYKDAAAGWKATLAQDPDAAVARAQYAQLLLRQHKSDQAAEVLQDVAPGDDGDPMLLKTQARLYLEQGRFSDAIGAYLDVQRIEPANHEVSFALADAYADAGRIGEAMDIYDHALAKHPKDEFLQNQLGLLEQRRGRDHLGDAIKHFRAAIALNPRFVAAKLNLANALFNAGPAHADEAAQQMHQVQALDPNNYVLYLNDAAMLFQLHDYAGAERMCQVAVELDPKSAEGWDNLGIAQAAQKNLAGAVWSFDRAVRANPDFARARAHLAAARRQLATPSPQTAAQ